jgi:hypothetical protein
MQNTLARPVHASRSRLAVEASTAMLANWRAGSVPRARRSFIAIWNGTRNAFRVPLVTPRCSLTLYL